MFSFFDHEQNLDNHFEKKLKNGNYRSQFDFSLNSFEEYDEIDN